MINHQKILILSDMCNRHSTHFPLLNLEIPPTPNPNGICPNGFDDLTPDSEYCYMITTFPYEVRTWGDAHAECNAYGSNLVSIHSDEVMTAIEDVIKDKDVNVWIGLQADSKFSNPTQTL